MFASYKDTNDVSESDLFIRMVGEKRESIKIELLSRITNVLNYIEEYISEYFYYNEELYNKAKEQYYPTDVSPFVSEHHVVCALESEDGRIFTGFCIESCSGVMALCAE